MPAIPAPVVPASAFVHPLASLCGRVTLGERVSVWAGAVVRGDTERITIGGDSNLQDQVIVHADPGVPTHIGSRVTVGHRAVIHGSVIADDVLIGIGAILLNGCVVGRGSIVGAGALCPEGMVVPENSLVLGVPGRVVRSTTDEERERIARTVAAYLRLSEAHAKGLVPYHLPGLTRGSQGA
jgi:carbonic anhydrase/acetyltransferase-like protein (isoleucine patch superfamily)